MFQHPFRVLFRLADFLIVTFLALSDCLLRVFLLGNKSYAERSRWAHKWAKQYQRCLHVDVTFSGQKAQPGLLAMNHLGYLDIVVLATVQPLVFVSKSEVRRWPIIGWLTFCGGTLFVNRQRKSEVASIGQVFKPVIDEAVPLVFFPEGTSTGGDRVLPFMPSLFEPAVQGRWTVTPGWIGYSLDHGSVADDIAYWRDMTFFPHFIHLLSLPAIHAKIVFSSPAPEGLDRKSLAKRLHDEIEEIARQNGALAKPAADSVSA